MADTAAPAVNQHPLSRLQRAGVDERLPGGDADERDGRARLGGHPVGEFRQMRLRNGDVLRTGPLEPVAQPSRERPVALGDGGYALTGRGDGPGTVGAGYPGQFARFVIAGPEVRIDRIDRRCLDFEQDLVRTWCGSFDVVDAEHVRPAVLVESYSTH